MTRSSRSTRRGALLVSVLALAGLGGPWLTTVKAQTASTAPACRDTDGNGNVDNDGDGLCDNWETIGLDVDSDGIIDAQLPGADLNHKDLYQEIDYMAGRRPLQDALDDVVLAFEKAPVANPDGTPGIRLHLQVDDQIPFASMTQYNVNCPATRPLPAGAAEYCAIRAQFFGTATERSRGTKALSAKSFAYRYALFADRFLPEPGDPAGSSTLGIATTSAPNGGDDMMISVGTEGGKRNIESGTYMHELGHLVGLQHGGRDNTYCKPNHLSVMNYNYEVENVPLLRRPLDFSRQQLPTLNEAALDEQVGIRGPAGRDTLFGPDPKRTAPTDGPIDWNRNGVIDTAPVLADINQGSICAGNATVLEGSDDWAGIVYKTLKWSQESSAAPAAESAAVGREAIAGETVFDPRHSDPTLDQLRAMSPDTDGDGVLNVDDDCVFNQNADQGDGDGDGIGNACEDDTAPVVDAGADVSGPAGFAIALHGGVTDDGDAADELEFSWDYAPTGPTDRGARCAIADPSAADTTVTCDQPGTYLLTLRATDGVTPHITDSTVVTVRATTQSIRCAALESALRQFTDPARRQQVELALVASGCRTRGTTTTTRPSTTTTTSMTTTTTMTPPPTSTTTRPPTSTTVSRNDAVCKSLMQLRGATTDPGQRQAIDLSLRSLGCPPPG